MVWMNVTGMELEAKALGIKKRDFNVGNFQVNLGALKASFKSTGPLKR